MFTTNDYLRISIATNKNAHLLADYKFGKVIRHSKYHFTINIFDGIQEIYFSNDWIENNIYHCKIYNIDYKLEKILSKELPFKIRLTEFLHSIFK